MHVERPRSKAPGTHWRPPCGECGYDRSGIDAGTSCPECGRAAAAQPELLRGTTKQEDLAELARVVSESAWSNLVSAMALIAAYGLAMVALRSWSLVPMALFVLAEASAVFCVVSATRVISSQGVKLDNAARYGSLTAITRIPAALAMVLPLASSQLASGESSGSDVAVVLGPLLMLGATVLYTTFLRNTARGVTAGARQARVDNVASAVVVPIAITGALVFCLIGLLVLPIALLLGALLNLRIAHVIKSAAVPAGVPSLG
jgi:hypothetical protein